MKKDLLDKILNDNERLAIQMFVDNEVQREAVKKVLLAEIYYNGVLKEGEAADPLRNFTLGLVSNLGDRLRNEALGEQLRAAWEGINMLEVAFNQLSIYKREDEPKKAKDNPAR